ncbi:MAG: DUF4491 family protein [Prevotellaceae bacterium]|jgi:branched-subunit amino acid transport protein|nr:DUF4491 family protein [Prevotellaceae bacterium]
MNFTGLIIGVCTLLIIGVFHPLVVKGEYYFGVKIWWIFLIAGIVGVILSLFIKNNIVSSFCGVFAFSALWGIGELFEQKKRVEKGWFPKKKIKNKK